MVLTYYWVCSRVALLVGLFVFPFVLFGHFFVFRGPGAGASGHTGSLPGCAEQSVLCPGGGKVDNQVKQTACRFLKAPQPTQLKSQERAANRKSPLSTGSDVKSGKHALARSLHSVTPARQLLFSGYTVVRFSGVVVSCGSPLC